MGLLDTLYAEAKKEYGPLGLRIGDFVPYVSGAMAIDDARLAAEKGNYGEAAGALTGLIPGGRLVKKLTGVDLDSVSPRNAMSVKRKDNGQVYYTDDGVRIGVWENPPYANRPVSIIDFVVDEDKRGTGIGSKALDDVLSRYNKSDISAATSSPASTAMMYKRGFRPAAMPSATLDDALNMMKVDSSVTMQMPNKSDYAQGLLGSFADEYKSKLPNQKEVMENIDRINSQIKDLTGMVKKNGGPTSANKTLFLMLRKQLDDEKSKLSVI